MAGPPIFKRAIIRKILIFFLIIPLYATLVVKFQEIKINGLIYGPGKIGPNHHGGLEMCAHTQAQSLRKTAISGQLPMPAFYLSNVL